MNEQPVYSVDEFEREAQYLDTLLWEALAVIPGTSMLICGYGPDGSAVKRALEIGAKVDVIEHRADVIRQHANLGAHCIRGSTSVIPASDGTYDLAVAHHYLHEADPFFHGQILSELARVANRVAIVEPAPPSDPLGKRIALLYSQAKRELGQFEYYQPIEYWKKLLQGVRAEIDQHVFAFSKVPPREYLRDTVELLLKTMEVEEVPKTYLDELRTIARRGKSLLLPPARFVLVGSPVGEEVAPTFSQRRAAPERLVGAPAGELALTQIVAAVARVRSAPATGAPQPSREQEITPERGYEFPPVEPPSFAPRQSGNAWRPGQSSAPDLVLPKIPPAAPPATSPDIGFGVPFATEQGSDTFGLPPPGQAPPLGWGESADDND